MQKGLCCRLRLFTCHFIFLLAVIVFDSTYATSIQRFTGFAFDNPARLSLVANKQIVMEGIDSLYQSHFVGSSLGGVGTAHGWGRTLPLYFRYAQRISDEWVAGIDITQPFIFDINYRYNAIVRYTETAFSMTPVDVAPNISYQPVKWLALGFGLDLMYAAYDNKIVIPSAQGDQLLDLTSSGRMYGWHAGALATINPTTSVGLTYFTPMTLNANGQSKLAGASYTRWSLKDTNMPATILLGATKKVLPAWTVAGLVSYSIWSINTLHYVNTSVGTISPAFHFTNTWRFTVLNNYQINPMWSGKMGVTYDQGPTNNTDRSIGAPTANALSIALGGGYQVTPAILAELSYTHVFFERTPLNHIPTDTYGSFSAYVNSIDAKLTWNL